MKDKQRQSPALPPEGFVREKQLIGDRKANPPIPGILPIARATLWQWVKDGKFPRPKKLSGGVTAWSVTTVRKYLDQ